MVIFTEATAALRVEIATLPDDDDDDHGHDHVHDDNDDDLVSLGLSSMEA